MYFIFVLSVKETFTVFFYYYEICAPPCLAFVTLLSALFIFIALVPQIIFNRINSWIFPSTSKKETEGKYVCICIHLMERISC